jgi:hypothetical protein
VKLNEKAINDARAMKAAGLLVTSCFLAVATLQHVGNVFDHI